MVAFGSERLLSAASIWACSVGHSLASAGPAAAAATTRAMTKLFISLPPWVYRQDHPTGCSSRFGSDVTTPVAHEPQGRYMVEVFLTPLEDRLDPHRASSVQVLVPPPVHRDTPRHAVGEDVVGRQGHEHEIVAGIGGHRMRGPSGMLSPVIPCPHRRHIER